MSVITVTAQLAHNTTQPFDPGEIPLSTDMAPVSTITISVYVRAMCACVCEFIYVLYIYCLKLAALVVMTYCKLGTHVNNTYNSLRSTSIYM